MMQNKQPQDISINRNNEDVYDTGGVTTNQQILTENKAWNKESDLTASDKESTDDKSRIVGTEPRHQNTGDFNTKETQHCLLPAKPIHHHHHHHHHQISSSNFYWLGVVVRSRVWVSYYITYPGAMEGWVGLSVINLLKVITLKRSWLDSNPRPLSH